MRRRFISLVVTWSLAAVVIFSCIALAEEAPRMTKEELKGMLSNLDVIIIDVRTERAWEMSELKIKGAVRENPSDVNSWTDKYPKDKTLVFY